MARKRQKSAAGSKKIEDKLIENMIELQKLNIRMVEKFEMLNSQISALLNLFESAAKSFALAPSTEMTFKDKEFLDKVDRLLEQNKTLAKGLTLMEQRLRGKIYGENSQEEASHSFTRRLEPEF